MMIKCKLKLLKEKYKTAKIIKYKVKLIGDLINID